MVAAIVNFSWVFLVEVLAFGFVSILFFFYFNLVFAVVVSRLIQVYTWNKYRVHIEFQSLQFSLLAGRIFFKSLRYHGENETILIHDGHITWRYWLRHVREIEITNAQDTKIRGNGSSNLNDAARGPSPSGGEQGGKQMQENLPCRIVVVARGLEWFVYNRSSAYDTILDRMKDSMENRGMPHAHTTGEHRADERIARDNPHSVTSLSSSLDERLSSDPVEENATSFEKPDEDFVHMEKIVSSHTMSRVPSSTGHVRSVKLPSYLTVFPIRIDCDRGAIVMGNENTRSVLVAKFDSANGLVDARRAAPQDLYRQCFDFEFLHPTIQLKPNEEFQESQLASGSRSKQAPNRDTNRGHRSISFFSYRRAKHVVLHSVRLLVPYFSRSVESILPDDQKSTGHRADPMSREGGTGQHRWLGLSRYLEDDIDGLVEQERWKAIEYGSFSTIIDSPRIAMSFFWDIPGLVSHSSVNRMYHSHEQGKDINGTEPPAWGVELKIGGGTVNYGPWADRQRNDLQAVFFPPLRAEAAVTESLKYGQTRISTVFQLVVELEKEITLRISTREESKDWKWKGHASTGSTADIKDTKKKAHRRRKGENGPPTSEIRPAGWLSMTVAKDSFITYTMDMVASGPVFHNTLSLDLKIPEMTSSVNHGVLWRSDALAIACDLSNPLAWNSLRRWSFDVHSDGMELFILRDHVFLLSDLIGDWTSGPSGEFNTFVPFNYCLRLVFPNFRIYLNVNDSNIINNPSDPNDNTFIIVWGTTLTVDLNIPLVHYKPLNNKVTFDVDAYHGGFRLCTPPWNTQHTFLESSDVATLKDLRFDGYYNYCSATAAGLTDTLILNLQGVAPTIHLYGFLIRYFIKIKDNYFGDDLHFQTLEEYQLRINKARPSDKAFHEVEPHTKLSNDLDVILAVAVENACLMLPANLYSAKDNIKIDVSSIALDLRFTNYYMDLEATFSPLSASRARPSEPQTFTAAEDSSTQAFVDGVVISSHRLFGLPPTEPTYVCNWDFAVGRVMGETSIENLSTLVCALECIAFTFGDAENALPPFDPLVLHDVTFLRAKVAPVRVWVHVGNSAFLFSTDTIQVNFNDWAGKLFSERVHMTIPKVTLACVDALSASQHRRALQPNVITWAYIQTSVDLRMVEAGAKMKEIRKLQQDHLRLHDMRTERTPWLMLEMDDDFEFGRQDQRFKFRPPAMQSPPMPNPVKNTDTVVTRGRTSKLLVKENIVQRPAAARQSSFLSNGSAKWKRTASEIGYATKGKYQNPLPEITNTRASSPEQARSTPTSPLPELVFRHNQADTSGRTQSEFPPSSVTFSSPYEVPYLPLHSVEPDTREVPTLPNVDNEEADEYLGLQEGAPGQAAAHDISHSTFVIMLKDGARALCTPDALRSVNNILAGLQAKDPAAILDEVQFDGMRDVQKKKKKASLQKITQFRLGIPCSSIRFRSNASPHDGEVVECQTYDLAMSHFVVTGRSTADQSQNVGPDRVSAHLSLKWLGLLVRGNREGCSRDSARINVSLRDTTLWLAKDQELSSQVQVESLDMASSNQKIEYLASLLNSTTELLEKTSDQFHTTAIKGTNRRRILVHWLATSDEDLTDPVLLTSGSYVLRSAFDHPRSSDTWKMMSRLRYILQCLPLESQQKLSAILDEPLMDLKVGTIEDVIVSFNRWRSWDLEHVKASSLLTTVFGTSASEGDRGLITIESPIQLSLKVLGISLVLNPGPIQNQVKLSELIILLRYLPTPTNNAIDISPDITNTLVVEAFCSNTTIHVNWDICELLGDILSNRGIPIEEGSRNNHISSQNAPSRVNMTIHLVLVIECVDLKFESINLNASSMVQGFRTSSILKDSVSGNIFMISTINAGLVEGDLSSMSKVLLRSKLTNPTIQASVQLTQLSPDHKIYEWKLGALCGTVDLDIQEDLLGLLGTIDTIIEDELAYVYELINSLDAQAPERRTARRDTPTKTAHHFDFLLVLNSYSVAVNVLSALRYSLEGNAARTSIGTRGSRNGLVVDFDAGKHSHAFSNQSEGTVQEISKLMGPPLNGRIQYHDNNELQTANISFAIEKITLDASAVYALLSTISRSEISSFANSFIQDIGLLQTHLVTISESIKRHEELPPHLKGALHYSMHGTMAGLSIKTVSGKGTAQSVRLVLELDTVYLYTSNHDSKTKQSTVFPDIDLNVRSIGLHLERVQETETSPCGEIIFGAAFHGTSRRNDAGGKVRSYRIVSSSLEISLYTETASMLVDVFGHLQEKFKTIDFSQEVRSIRANRRHRRQSHAVPLELPPTNKFDPLDETSVSLFNSMYSLELSNIQVSWRIGNLTPISPTHAVEDLVLSVTKIDLATERGNAARLMIENFQLQMVPTSQSKTTRSFNSALMPEVVFHVAYLSTSNDRRLAFQVAGKSLDLRLTSQFILPASDLQRSIGLASEELRGVVANWNAALPQTGSQPRNILGKKKFSSLLVDADFAGAVVYIQGRKISDPQIGALNILRGGRLPQHGRYGQFTDEDASSNTTMRAPGLAWKIEYKDLGLDEPSLNAEIKVDASTNVLYPTVVPLILEITSSIKEIVGEPDETQRPQEAKASPTKLLQDEKLKGADPTAILGNCSLNLGLRICRQEFTLSCQPIARVAATAQFEDIYITVNTVQAKEQRFFAVGTVITCLQASVQHVYSRESTGSFKVDSIHLSLMNSKHVRNVKGLSAILKISPMHVLINIKQLHDFLLFREIWVPLEMRHSSPPASTMSTSESQMIVVQRYQQVAAAGAFLWNASISITTVDIQLDLGQSIGKSAFSISGFWVSSKKTSEWEQNLCLGFDKIGMRSTGRMSGLVELQSLRLRTAIMWVAQEGARNQPPLIQASLTFDDLQVKAAFDYQPFVVANLLSLDFLMYNVRDPERSGGDRLVAIVSGDKVQAFCTTTSSAQAIALYQAVQRLIQEKEVAYQTSLNEIEKYLRRNSTAVPFPLRASHENELTMKEITARTPVQLHTNVVVTLKAINIGAYPRTFFDRQIFKLEALNTLARFTVSLEEGKVHSGLGLTLGQLRIALSDVSAPSVPKTHGDIAIDEVVRSATSSRGGTILKVPRVVASMQTWQIPDSNHIDYIFKSSFEGKVEVGWNYSRVSFIRGMWSSHSRALAQRLGKPLPPSAVQITGAPKPLGEDEDGKPSNIKQQKITAMVMVPESKYDYTALEAPVIETPQLREMGEATPPLEWIGLQRERLPNLTHQIVIVSLLEVAREVEDAYSKILGSS
ncbi:hypothetical protein MMC13_006759 [Lambiella insularis]|nr:hypothetical protein [Lambiella insularis]